MIRKEIENNIKTKNSFHGHTEMGILFIDGESIKKNIADKSTVNIMDLAPTILWLFNVEIPNDMDGKVLKEFFNIDRKPVYESQIVKYRADKKNGLSEKDEIDIKNRLRKLGYLS